MTLISKATLGAVLAVILSTFIHLFRGLDPQFAFYMLFGALSGIASMRVAIWILEK